MIRFGLFAAAALLSASPVLAAPQCMEMRFLDAQGVVIPVSPPLVGVMVGSGPLFEGRPPQHAKRETGRLVPCPEPLIASVRKTFEQSCTSADKRKAAAALNKTNIARINKRCGDLMQTLTK